MSGDTVHHLGVDGLPLGTHAALSADGATSSFSVAEDGTVVRPVTERVRQAVVVDDGDDGTVLRDLDPWLDERSIRMRLLRASPGAGGGDGPDASRRRAEAGAQWPPS